MKQGTFNNSAPEVQYGIVWFLIAIKHDWVVRFENMFVKFISINADLSYVH